MASHHSNPFLDTRVYEVQFQDGSISEHAAKLISEKNHSQTGLNFNEFLLLKDILDHISTNKAVKPEDTFEVDPVKWKYKKTMTVLEPLVEWYDKTQP